MKNCIVNKFKNLIIFTLIFIFIFPFNFFLSFKESNNVNINSVVYADSENSESEEFEKLYISSLLSMLGITFNDSSSLGKEFNNIIDYADKMQKPFIDVLKKMKNEIDFVDIDGDTEKEIYNFLKTLPKNILNELSDFAFSITDKVDEIHFRNLFKKYANEHFLRMTFKDTYDLMKLEEMGYLDDYLMFKEYSKFYLAMLELYLSKNGLSEREPISPEPSSEFFTLQRGDSIYRVYFYPSENLTLTKNGTSDKIINSDHPLIDAYRVHTYKDHDTYEVYINENPPSLVYNNYNEVGSSSEAYITGLHWLNTFDTKTGEDGFPFTDNSITLYYHPFKVVEVKNNKFIKEVNSQLFTYNNYFLYHDYKTFVSNYEYEFILFLQEFGNYVDKPIEDSQVNTDNYKNIDNRTFNYIYNYNTVNNFYDIDNITNNYYINGENLEKKLDNFIDSYKHNSDLVNDYLEYLATGIQNLDRKVTKILEDGLFIGDIDELAEKISSKLDIPDIKNLVDEFKVFVEQLLDKRLSTIENDLGFIKNTVKTIKTNTDIILSKISTFSLGENTEKIASDLKEKDENGKSLWDKIKDFFKDFGNFFKGIFDFFKDFFTVTEKFDLHKINTEGLGKKIPFSIFSDISNLFKSFLATPEAPKFSFKLITVPVTIDFNNFAELGKIIRIGSFVFFVFFLVSKFYSKVG